MAVPFSLRLIAYSNIFFLCINALLSQENVKIEPRPFIKLTNPIDTSAKDQLPSSFAQGWPTWVLDEEGSFSKIPDSDGFVPPASIDELWQPVDLKYPKMRFALGVHVRNGQLRHIMPAVDLSFEGGTHRNRGMCSVPRAHAWINYMIGLEQFKLRMYSRSTKVESNEWELLRVSKVPIKESLTRSIQALFESPPDELGEGSHIIHVLLEDGVIMECPKAGVEFRVTLSGSKHEETDDDESTAPGILQVVISSVNAGSDSDYLPDAYKPLYSDSSLRRSAYEKIKERQSTIKEDIQDMIKKENEL